MILNLSFSGGRKVKIFPFIARMNTAPYLSLRNEIDRVFDSFFYNGFGLSQTGNLSGISLQNPNLDVSESDKELTIRAELAGVNEKDLDVTLVGDILTIKGEKKHEKEENDGDRTYVERHYGSFSRVIRLPFEASDKGVSANMKKGVLMIKIAKPKAYQPKSRRIEIAAA
ncbi:MAG: Hsp20/alpha crystallin family protein [Pseudomonadota bacterium]